MERQHFIFPKSLIKPALSNLWATGYLYHDGTVIIHRREFFVGPKKDQVRVEKRIIDVFVNQTIPVSVRKPGDSWGYQDFVGRLIISDLTILTLPVRYIDCWIDTGSEESRRRGIFINGFSVKLQNGGHLYFHELPGVISGSFTLQNDPCTAMTWVNDADIDDITRVHEPDEQRKAA